MATLLYENGPNRGRGIELEPGKTYNLGRDPRADVKIQDELSSRQHCQIKEFKGAWYIRDLDSRNGTLVNDRTIKQQELRFGDKIQIGAAILTLVEESMEALRKEKILSGYRLEKRIGRGGMGTVFRATQLSLDREVALKVLSPDLVKDDSFVQQFQREARAAGAMNHPHIVQVYDVGQDDGAYFYSMEYVGGGSLEDRLREAGKIDVDEALQVALQASLALEFAESKHIVHRDIKPDNLMLTEDGRVKVADLGLALSLKGSADHAGQPILGTPHFISPEQALRREVDIRSDIYSLGATLYRMLSGRTVFQGSSAEEIIRKAVKEEPTPLRELVPEVPEKVAALVHRMLAKNPDERPGSAAELRAELEELTRHPRRTAWIVGAFGVAAVAIAIAVIFALKKPEKEIIRVGEEEMAKSREAEFQAKSALEQKEIELQSVRDYLKIVEGDLSRPELYAALTRWSSDFDYLSTAEMRRTRATLARIESERGAEAEAAQKREQRRKRRLADAETAVKAAMGSNDFLSAWLAAESLRAEEGDPPEDRELFAVRRLELQNSVRTQAEAAFSARKEEVDEAAREQRFEEAIGMAADAAEVFAALPEEAPIIDELPLGEYHHYFVGLGESLRTRQVRLSHAVERRDRARVAQCLVEVKGSLLQLQLDKALDRLQSTRQSLEGESELAFVDGQIDRLKRAGDLLGRLLQAGEQEKLAPRPVIQIGSTVDRPAELAAYDPAERVFRLKISSGLATVQVKEALTTFATPDGLRQLFWSRLDMTPEEQVTLAELMLLVDVARMAASFDPLRGATQTYDPLQGWQVPASTPPPTSTPGFLETVQWMSREGAFGVPARMQALADEYRGEQQCQNDLALAAEPFVKPDPVTSWKESEVILGRVMERDRGTLLLQMLWSLVDASELQ